MKYTIDQQLEWLKRHNHEVLDSIRESLLELKEIKERPEHAPTPDQVAESPAREYSSVELVKRRQEIQELEKQNQRLLDVSTFIHDYFEVSSGYFNRKINKRPFQNKLCIYVALLKKYCPKTTLTELGQIAGDRNHATIINQIRKYEDFYGEDAQFTATVDNAIRYINIMINKKKYEAHAGSK